MDEVSLEVELEPPSFFSGKRQDNKTLVSEKVYHRISVFMSFPSFLLISFILSRLRLPFSLGLELEISLLCILEIIITVADVPTYVA